MKRPLLMGLIILAALAAAPGAQATQPSIFLLVLDEMPVSTLMNQKEEIDQKRFPHFAKLASQSTWYRNHTVVADFTYASIPSILYGQRPSDGSGHNNYDYREGHSLYNLLSSGYKRTVWQDINPVCPRCPRPKPSNHLAGARLKAEIGYQDYNRYAAGAIASIKKRNRPNLWVTHLLLPHVPWQFLPNGAQYREEDIGVPGMVFFSWDSQEYPLAFNQQRMILQSQFVDRVIGSFTRKIKQAGLWDSSLVIITADHGGDFIASRHRRSVLETRFSEAANVPLLVKYPGQKRGLISDQSTNHTNILPTINALTSDRADYRATTLQQAGYNTSPRVRNSIDDTTVSTTMQKLLTERRQVIDIRNRRVSSENPFLLNSELPLFGGRVGHGRLGLVAGQASGSLSLEHPEYYRNIKPYSKSIPAALLTARVYGLDFGDEVAVAINNQIVASGQVFNFWPQPQDAFKGPQYRKEVAMMLNPRSLPSGRAKLSFYLVSQAGLLPIRQR